MKISFQKQVGNPDLGILYFWCLKINTKNIITEQWIPELFYDCFYIKDGQIKTIDFEGRKRTLPQKTLKMIYTKPFSLYFSTPLVLYGARLSLRFAESFQGKVTANEFQNQAWVKNEAKSLGDFANQVTSHVESQCELKNPYPMFKKEIQESDWLKNFSPRHKRRLYQNTFGISRKEMLNIQNVQTFLNQVCNFGYQNPRIIQYVNSEVFYDQPHLNHKFRKMTGFSPVEYFEKNSVLQDNLMSASYNEIHGS